MPHDARPVNPPAQPAQPELPTAWWRLPIVWMVIGGPALVVLASFVTLALAINNPDPVLATPLARTQAEQPAVQGRNHAATPTR